MGLKKLPAEPAEGRSTQVWADSGRNPDAWASAGSRLPGWKAFGRFRRAGFVDHRPVQDGGDYLEFPSVTVRAALKIVIEDPLEQPCSTDASGSPARAAGLSGLDQDPVMRNSFIPLLIWLAFTPWAHAQGDDMQPIRGFAIDRKEVSIAQFARYAQATGVVTAAEKAGGDSTYEGGWVQRKGWTWRTPFGLQASESEPAVHISFAEARAYCQWAGQRLPSDAEWMEAAYTERRAQPPAGLQNGQTYPYPTGSSPLGANCLGDCGAAPTPAAYANPTITTRGRGHAPTGSTKVGVNGLFEMGANAWEWTDGGTDGARPTRGGSWWYGAAQMHRDHLQSKPAETAVVYIGFRCAKNLL